MEAEIEKLKSAKLYPLNEHTHAAIFESIKTTGYEIKAHIAAKNLREENSQSVLENTEEQTNSEPSELDVFSELAALSTESIFDKMSAASNRAVGDVVTVLNMARGEIRPEDYKDISSEIAKNAQVATAHTYMTMQILRVFLPEKYAEINEYAHHSINVLARGNDAVQEIADLLKVGTSPADFMSSLTSGALGAATGNVFGAVAGFMGAVDGLLGLSGKRDSASMAMLRQLRAISQQIQALHEDLIKYFKHLNQAIHELKFLMIFHLSELEISLRRENRNEEQILLAMQAEISKLLSNTGEIKYDLKEIISKMIKSKLIDSAWITKIKNAEKTIARAREKGATNFVDADKLTHHLRELYEILETAKIEGLLGYTDDICSLPDSPERDRKVVDALELVSNKISATHTTLAEKYQVGLDTDFNLVACLLKDLMHDSELIKSSTDQITNYHSPAFFNKVANLVVELIQHYQENPFAPPLRWHHITGNATNISSKDFDNLTQENNQNLHGLIQAGQAIEDYHELVANKELLPTLTRKSISIQQEFTKLLEEIWKAMLTQREKEQRNFFTDDLSDAQDIRVSLNNLNTQNIPVYIHPEWYRVECQGTSCPPPVDIMGTQPGKPDCTSEIQESNWRKSGATFREEDKMFFLNSYINRIGALTVQHEERMRFLEARHVVIGDSMENINKFAKTLPRNFVYAGGLSYANGQINGAPFLLPIPNQIIEEIPLNIRAAEALEIGQIMYKFDWIKPENLIKISVSFNFYDKAQANNRIEFMKFDVPLQAIPDSLYTAYPQQSLWVAWGGGVLLSEEGNLRFLCRRHWNWKNQYYYRRAPTKNNYIGSHNQPQFTVTEFLQTEISAALENHLKKMHKNLVAPVQALVNEKDHANADNIIIPGFEDKDKIARFIELVCPGKNGH